MTVTEVYRLLILLSSLAGSENRSSANTSASLQADRLQKKSPPDRAGYAMVLLKPRRAAEGLAYLTNCTDRGILLALFEVFPYPRGYSRQRNGSGAGVFYNAL